MKFAAWYAESSFAEKVWNVMENDFVAAGTLISIARRLPGGGACAGREMTAIPEAVAVVANVMFNLQT